MALNLVYAYSKEQTREWPVAALTQAGKAVISISDQAGVTLTARGDSVVTKVLADGTSITRANGGVGNRSDSATVAVDGSWAFPVVGATAATPKNTPVFFVVADGTLTLTVGTNKKFGVVDSYLGKASATDTAVKIGVFA